MAKIKTDKTLFDPICYMLHNNKYNCGIRTRTSADEGDTCVVIFLQNSGISKECKVSTISLQLATHIDDYG